MQVNSINTAEGFLPEIKRILNDDSVPQQNDFEEEWKGTLANYSPDKKKVKLLSTVHQLRTDNTLTLFQFRKCLRILEDIALSPRVSKLNMQGYYTRLVPNFNNHPHSMHGLATYLKTHYPNEQIVFAFDANSKYIHGIESFNKYRRPSSLKFITDLRVNYIDICQFKSKLENKPVYFVYEYSHSEHKVLFIMQKETTGYVLSFFDSLGVNPWKRLENDGNYYYQMKDLVDNFSKIFEPLHVEAIDIARQKDRVNCGVFIIHDFNTAEGLIRDKKPLFVDKATPQPAFFEISQRDEDLHLTQAAFHRLKGDESNQNVNIRSHLLALDILNFYLEAKASYPEPAQEGEESEDDENDCVIM